MYHYTESGLSNIYLLNGFMVENIDGEEYTSIDDMNGLHSVIASAIVDSVRPLKGDEFKFLRVAINLSQKALGVKFGVNEQTVARWEKEESLLARTADASLRALYLESINVNSSIGLFLEILADAEAQEAAKEIRMEEVDHQWAIAV